MRTHCKDCGVALPKPNPKRPYCKTCRNARERAKYDSAKDRARHLRYYYGISPEEYALMYAEQAGRCWICREPQKRLVVDHNHKTGEVRRLLCFGCNNMVGYMENNPKLVARIERYIEDHGILPE